MNRLALLVLFTVLAIACTPSGSGGDAEAGAGSTPTLLPPSPEPLELSPTVLQFLHRTGKPHAPVANPSWYGQPAYRDPSIRAAANGQGPPVYQASWAVTDWWIDPVAGNDANTCTATGSPCKTYAQVAARLGTYAPRIRQNTTFHFKSSQPDNTDPVILLPFVENGAVVIIKGELPATPAITGTLAGVVSKNRATPQLLNATVGAGGVAGQLIVNSTHPSRAFLYKVVAGNTWAMTQPLVPLTPPLGFGAGVEVDTWANGDAYSVYNLVNIFVADFEVIQLDSTSSFGNPGYVWQATTFSPDGSDTGQLNGNVALVETDNPISFLVVGLSNAGFFSVNTFSGGYTVESPAGYVGSFQPTAVIGAGYFAGILGGGPYQFELDTITDFSSGNGVYGALITSLYIGSTDAITLLGPSQVTGIVWGTGSINVASNQRLVYPTGAGAATANFLQTGGLRISGVTTACSHTNAAPDVVDCGITLTPAHLDAAQGVAGFGGFAYAPGGGSISNGAF